MEASRVDLEGRVIMFHLTNFYGSVMCQAQHLAPGYQLGGVAGGQGA